MRGASRRAWVKLYITGILHGSIRWQLEPDERSVFIDLLCMAGECSKEGKICDNDSLPFPRSYIANHLNIATELLERTIKKCIDTKRIDEEDGVLVITNWTSYQSEYERQKPYRQRQGDDGQKEYTESKPGKFTRRELPKKYSEPPTYTDQRDYGD